MYASGFVTTSPHIATFLTIFSFLACFSLNLLCCINLLRKKLNTNSANFSYTKPIVYLFHILLNFRFFLSAAPCYSTTSRATLHQQHFSMCAKIFLFADFFFAELISS